MFPATQTYSDGEVVEWAEPTVAGEEEPEFPAPALDLSEPPGEDVTSNDDSSSDTLVRVLGAAGLALGAVALGWVALGRRSPRPAT